MPHGSHVVHNVPFAPCRMQVSNAAQHAPTRCGDCDTLATARTLLHARMATQASAHARTHAQGCSGARRYDSNALKQTPSARSDDTRRRWRVRFRGQPRRRARRCALQEWGAVPTLRGIVHPHLRVAAELVALLPPARRAERALREALLERAELAVGQHGLGDLRRRPHACDCRS